jgi:hypothetical protein
MEAVIQPYPGLATLMPYVTLSGKELCGQNEADYTHIGSTLLLKGSV